MAWSLLQEQITRLDVNRLLCEGEPDSQMCSVFCPTWRSGGRYVRLRIVGINVKELRLFESLLVSREVSWFVCLSPLFHLSWPTWVSCDLSMTSLHTLWELAVAAGQSRGMRESKKKKKLTRTYTWLTNCRGYTIRRQLTEARVWLIFVCEAFIIMLSPPA